MTQQQLTILAVVAMAIAMFIWGRWRYDMIAVGAMLACVLTGLVPSQAAFAGFGHPAVVTVVCVLILSKGLQSTGAVDALTRRVLPANAGPLASIVALTGLVALLSGFMNNVGALALVMPVALQLAAKKGLPPGKVLMPVAFGSILGGTTTLIGTPPNLIVSGFRAEAGLGGFTMFDFTPVGLAVTVLGVTFVALVGWRLVPGRKPPGAAGFDIGKYLTEVCVAPTSAVANRTVGHIEEALRVVDAQVVGLAHDDLRVYAPASERLVRPGDVLVLEADPKSLAPVLADLGLAFEGDGTCTTDPDREQTPGGALLRDTALLEVVVLQNSALLGRTATGLNLRTTHNLNLLAITHNGRRSIRRLRTTPLQAGDVLLMQGLPDALSDFAAAHGCVPLARPAFRIPDKRLAMLAGLIMAGAVGVAAVGALPASLTFAAAVVLYMALRVIPLRSVYEAVDWPVVVLLGAMIPVAGAMSSTGAADVIARFLQENIAQGRPVVGLAVIIIATMLLTDSMNNAATAAVMCPIAMRTAAQLQVSADPFLMAVAIGASCAFLTPIGHQNNTLILGPGGFRFGDYWRMGLPLDILVVTIAVPMLLRIWPL